MCCRTTATPSENVWKPYGFEVTLTHLLPLGAAANKRELAGARRGRRRRPRRPHRAPLLLDEVGLHGNGEPPSRRGMLLVVRLGTVTHSRGTRGPGDELPVVLEHTAVPGIRVDGESGVRDAPRQVGRKAAGDH